MFNPLNAELNPICHLLALLGGATIIVVSRLRIKIRLIGRKWCGGEGWIEMFQDKLQWLNFLDTVIILRFP